MGAMFRAVLVVSILSACGGKSAPAPAAPSTPAEESQPAESSGEPEAAADEAAGPPTTEIQDPTAKEAIEWLAPRAMPGMDVIGSASLVLEPGKTADIPFHAEAGTCIAAIVFAKASDVKAAFVLAAARAQVATSVAMGPLAIVQNEAGRCWLLPGAFNTTIWLRLSSEIGGPASFQIYSRH
jgi:hypothetical protein